MKGKAPKSTVLVVDDDRSARGPLVEYLSISGYSVMEASGAREALGFLPRQKVDIVITDLKMPDMDGITMLGRIKEQDPDVLGIVMTGYGTIESAVKAMKVGAFDYLTKPFNLDEVGIVMTRAMDYRELRRENEFLRMELSLKQGFDDLIGGSPVMNEVFSMIKKVADTDATVLIMGESGTGKEMVARTIHKNSRRAKKPIVPVNCGAIPGELLESELFGHEKGAFTGAIQSRMGRFEMATGGTIFLDEIGDMSANLQVKLLRVLQEREFERVGGERTIKVDVRVIAATHQDLEKLVEDRAFREDLFYRLNVIQIKLPSLRERVEDIPMLVEHFIGKHGRGKDRDIAGASPEVMEVFKGYRWPGNVRELENIIERGCILRGAGVITVAELPDKLLKKKDFHPQFTFRLPTGGIDFNNFIENLEKDMIMQALQRADGVKNRAAGLLGLGRTTLVEKMKKKNLTTAAIKPQKTRRT
ncbi:MAG TPA: sigma-54 dependent transcriptional regulator [Nitrospirota bacterium]|jgi:DNA-binding NtrC family response regulator